MSRPSIREVLVVTSWQAVARLAEPVKVAAHIKSYPSQPVYQNSAAMNSNANVRKSIGARDYYTAHEVQLVLNFHALGLSIYDISAELNKLGHIRTPVSIYIWLRRRGHWMKKKTESGKRVVVQPTKVRVAEPSSAAVKTELFWKPSLSRLMAGK